MKRNPFCKQANNIDGSKEIENENPTWKLCWKEESERINNMHVQDIWSDSLKSLFNRFSMENFYRIYLKCTVQYMDRA